MGRLLILLAAAGCLQTPPATDGESDLADASTAVDGPVPVDLADAAASPCPNAFAAAYTNRIQVGTDGGLFAGMMVIEALGAEVDLALLTSEPDDSAQVELELSHGSTKAMTPGQVFGSLHNRARDSIIGPVVSPDDWQDQTAPIFRLVFSPVSNAEAHFVSAKIHIGESFAVVDFKIEYDAEGLVRPLEAIRVASTCSPGD